MTVDELAARLWIPESELPSDVPRRCYGPPLTDQTLLAAEAKLGLKLPPDYVEFMRFQNGGYLRLHSTEVDGAYVDLRQLGGLGTESGPEELGVYMVEEWGYPQPAVYLGGAGHTALLFDYRAVNSGEAAPIVWVDVELGEERPAFAASFHDLMLQLVQEQGQ